MGTSGAWRDRLQAHGHPPRVPEENRRAGTGRWWDSKSFASGREIEGYASQCSAAPGESLDLHVSTAPAARYDFDVFRLGWYNGDGARLFQTVRGRGPGSEQDAQPPDPKTGAVACRWPVSDVIHVGEDWPSGMYLVRLVLADGEHAGRSAWIPFVVRAPQGATSQVLVQMPTNTAQAYNNWGGKSLYPSNSTSQTEAVMASYDRPYPAFNAANLNARWPFIWDYQLIRFLEREGYDVSYTTNVDTHRDPASLLRHRLVMTSGHDEYWTSEMRTAFESARDAGVSLAFMGANTAYWQIRYEDGERTIVEYRRHTRDPEEDRSRTTVRFRDLQPPRPECTLLGIQYQEGMTGPGQPPRHYQVVDSALADPWMADTGFAAGDHLHGLVGYEWDALQKGCSPPGAPTVFFHYDNPLSNADCVRYTAPSGAVVFATGSIQFSWGLDDWYHPGHADERLQRFMRNAMEGLVASGGRGFSRRPAAGRS